MFSTRLIRKLGPALVRELSAPSPAGDAGRPIPIVALCSGEGLRVLERHHEVTFSSRALGYAALLLTKQDVLRVARDSGVMILEKDERYASLPAPLPMTGPRNADVFARYHVGALRDLDGEGITIMVQDSGFSRHEDIPAQVRAIDCTEEGLCLDHHGHGTAIVSQMLASGPYPGLVPKANIVMARIFDRQMHTTLSRILRACSMALEHEVHIVSMSYGGPLPNPVISLALEKLHSAGIALIAAAGNSGPGSGTIEYPAGYAWCLAVAAVDKQGRLAPFSSRGRPGQHPMKPDLALEGVNVVMAKSADGTIGTPVSDGYIMASGTSFACPIGASLAAMILQSNGPKTSPARIAEIMRSACR